MRNAPVGASPAALADAGYVEALNNPFLGVAELDALGLAADDPRRATVDIAEPLVR